MFEKKYCTMFKFYYVMVVWRRFLVLNALCTGSRAVHSRTCSLMITTTI